MSGDVHVQFCERRWGKFLASTHLACIAASREALEDHIKPAIINFLKERGLELSVEKTVISHVYDGFDFLGFNVRKNKKA